MDRKEAMAKIRAGGHVRRCHTLRVLHPQTVAEHSWNVAQILYRICRPSPELIRAALNHDLPEEYIGDIPAPIKWESVAIDNGVKSLEDKWHSEVGTGYSLGGSESTLLKVADCMEFLMYCNEELALGNSNVLVNADKAVVHFNNSLRPLVYAHTGVMELYSSIIEELEKWRKHYER